MYVCINDYKIIIIFQWWQYRQRLELLGTERSLSETSPCQAAIKALNSNVINSKMVYDIHIVWVAGNCRVDELARRGTTIELRDKFSNLDIPMRTCKLIIDNAVADSVNDRFLLRNFPWQFYLLSEFLPEVCRDEIA